MEIITFDHRVFRDLSNKIDKIADYVFKKETTPSQEPEVWLTSDELADLFKISTCTLLQMRKDKTIVYSLIRNKCLYRLSGVEQSIRERIISCNPQTFAKQQLSR